MEKEEIWTPVDLEEIEPHDEIGANMIREFYKFSAVVINNSHMFSKEFRLGKSQINHYNHLDNKDLISRIANVFLGTRGVTLYSPHIPLIFPSYSPHFLCIFRSTPLIFPSYSPYLPVSSQ